MSITRAQRVRLNIFLLAGLTLIVVFVTITVGVRFRDRDKRYYAIWEEESLSGLEAGASVKYLGVKIGRVSDISWDPRDLNRVTVTLDVDHDFPMKEDMYAQMWMMGVTMQMYIDIMGGTDESDMLPPNSIIDTKPSVMSAISGKAEVITAKIEQLLNQIMVFTHPDSLASFRRTMNNIADISDDVRMVVDGLPAAVDMVTDSTRAIVRSVNNIATHIGAVSSDLRRGIEDVDISAIATRLDTTLQSLKTLSESTELTLRQSREDIMVIMENVRDASESANELMRTLSENPSLLIRGEQQKERAY